MRELPLSWFDTLEYTDKDDVINAVTLYHHRIRRTYVVKQTNTTRWAAECMKEGCLFKITFNMKCGVKRPSLAVPHSCEEGVDPTDRRCESVRFITWLPKVRELILAKGRDLVKKELGNVVREEGIKITRKQLHRSYKQRLEWRFGSEKEQYGLIRSYVEGMIEKGHYGNLEQGTDGRFNRVVIVYREGIQAFSQYAMRGLQLDGTFLKSASGGVLLVACFRDGNNNIRMVAVAIVSGETEANWRWFLETIQPRLIVQPAFIISDRDKGMMAAVAKVFPDVHHAACFRHVMENFNKRYKEKPLKDLAWSLAKASTVEEFQRTVEGFKVKPAALEWLRDQVGMR